MKSIIRAITFQWHGKQWNVTKFWIYLIDETFYLIQPAKFCSPVGSFQLANAEPFSNPNCHVGALVGRSFWCSRTQWFSPTQNGTVDGGQVVASSISVEATVSQFNVGSFAYTSSESIYLIFQNFHSKLTLWLPVNSFYFFPLFSFYTGWASIRDWSWHFHCTSPYWSMGPESEATTQPRFWWNSLITVQAKR